MRRNPHRFLNESESKQELIQYCDDAIDTAIKGLKSDVQDIYACVKDAKRNEHNVKHALAYGARVKENLEFLACFSNMKMAVQVSDNASDAFKVFRKLTIDSSFRGRSSDSKFVEYCMEIWDNQNIDF